MSLIAKTISIEVPKGWNPYRVCESSKCKFGPKGQRTRRPLDQTFCPGCKRPLVIEWERVKICPIHGTQMRRYVNHGTRGRFYSHWTPQGWCHGKAKA